MNSTRAATAVTCWDASLGKPGPVQIATSGTWQGTTIGLKGGPGKTSNHAKIGVGTGANSTDVILGDLNQEGALAGKCDTAQNGRGGLFFVVDNATFHKSVAALLKGESAPE